MAREYVYFAQGAESKNIKIGWSTDLWNRLAHIQAHSGEHIVLRMHIVGEDLRSLETCLHMQFGAHRLHGEWFSPAPEILVVIEQLRAGMTERELADYDAQQAIWIANPERINVPNKRHSAA